MKNFKKLTTVILSTLLMFSSLSYVHADEESDVKKEETVYAFLDANGNFKGATVSEWLHSDGGFVNVKDESILSDIKNLKGDEEPTINGNSLTWNSDKSDIYYQGTTSKELPLNMQVTYYFDGQKVDINDVVGQSGKLEIHIKLVNNEEKTEVINGKTRHISTLFPCIILTDLKTDIFEDVDADGAIVVNESKNQVVSFVTVSGASKLLNDSSITELNDIKDKLKDEFVIKANVTNLEMPSIYCAVSGMVDLDENNISASDLNELKNGINDLQSAMNTILDGSNSLTSGANDLKSGASTLNEGANSLNSGISQAQSGLSELAGYNSAITAGSKQLKDGAKLLQSKIEEKASDVTTLVTGSAQFKNALSSDSTSLTYGEFKVAVKANSNGLIDVDSIQTSNQQIIEQLTNAVQSGQLDETTKATYTNIINVLTADKTIIGATDTYLQSAKSTLSNSYSQIDGGINQIANMMENSTNEGDAKNNPTLKDGIDTLVTGTETLDTYLSAYTNGVDKAKTGLDTIANGANSLVGGSKQIADGSATLSDGANELNDGLKKFNSEGISELSTKVNDAIGTLDDVVDVVNEVLDQSVEYNNYAGADSSMETTVKFIMKTDEVSIKEETKETVSVDTQEESTTFWQRLVNLFKK